MIEASSRSVPWGGRTRRSIPSRSTDKSKKKNKKERNRDKKQVLSQERS